MAQPRPPARSTTGLEPDDKIDAKFWVALSKNNAPVLHCYKITTKDLSEEYVERLPKDYAELAKMKRWATCAGMDGLRQVLRAVSGRTIN